VTSAAPAPEVVVAADEDLTTSPAAEAASHESVKTTKLARDMWAGDVDEVYTYARRTGHQTFRLFVCLGLLVIDCVFLAC
jgi:hypothetical protein